jgi:nudix-type nucleoside diphosphatase (YffH/AdpP family)
MKVDIKSKRLVFDDFFKVEEATLRYQRFDGTMSATVSRRNFVRGDSVAAIVFNADTQHVILVNQFKYPTYDKGPGWICEVVAGILEESESPEDAIRRELIEEIGYRSRRLRHISTFYVSPGGTSERIILFYAEVTNEDRIGSGGGVEAEGENIRLVELSLSDLHSALESNDIVDAKTLVGALWLQQENERQP